MGESVLVTGGTGFIGTQLVRRLVADGHDVHLLARAGGSGPDGIHVIEDAGTTSELADRLAGLDVSACFHLATRFVAEHGGSDVEDLLDSNVVFGTRVAEALAARRGVTFVNTGTAWQHVDGSPYRSTSLYAATKQALQDVLSYYATVGRLRVVHLKLFDTYGPSDRRPKLVNVLLDAARTGATVEMSPGEQLIDLLHVDDAVDAFLHAWRAASEEERSFAAPSGDARTVRSLVATVAQVTDRRVDVVFGARPYRETEMFTPWHVAPRPPGWAPAIPLEDGLAEVWRSRSSRA